MMFTIPVPGQWMPSLALALDLARRSISCSKFVNSSASVHMSVSIQPSSVHPHANRCDTVELDYPCSSCLALVWLDE